jgi:hypothetical protein
VFRAAAAAQYAPAAHNFALQQGIQQGRDRGTLLIWQNR